MAFARITRRIFTWTPVAADTTETISIATGLRGYRLTAGHIQCIQAPSASITGAIKIGDSTDDDGFLTAAVATITKALGVEVDFNGALLANSGGRLFLDATAANSNISLVYTATGDAVGAKPIFRVIYLMVRD